MSKSKGIWRIGLPLSVTLDGCKEHLRICWRFGCGIVSSIRRRHNQIEVKRQANANHLCKAVSCQQLIEFTKLLSKGDRIRVLCDDGVLVAEKISRTQFKVIDCQKASELVH